ncbi:ATP-binding cassette domain-containing protein [Streptomyces filamentosus]|uniref:ATP-binding cassette domain-containing protein n=2 Tax=Streptomyces filamentosus TaxID=67294 RepID=A0ABY4V4A4_STRFL|nr:MULTISPECIES: ATP-binding cassette domain-containing protein [Streptomyces]EFE74139.1 ABC transporter ATP-binding protein [Streptomyces filamentosus NRRL 15998]MYR78302.1 ATP-binding cassette domain-containing protein [Streptomyces sp. SID5466]USC50067.1 ATP-binding cassette domain-containing protein [Streptomyces filamentosus]
MTSLTQGYDGRRIIEDLDLSIQTGVTGLLGPNGAGKTTLFRTLATIAPPWSGLLELFGEPVSNERQARRARRSIGYLPQDFGYYPAFSITDFVRYCAWLREVPSRKAESLTREALGAVGLADRAQDHMKSLSGGMLRRAGIAAAIVGSPDLLLLDEPTVGLDPAQRLDFRELIRSLARAGTAVVLSTHLVEDVGAACDTVLVLNDGQVRHSGTPQQLAELAAPTAPGDNPLERGYMTVLGGQWSNEGDAL